MKCVDKTKSFRPKTKDGSVSDLSNVVVENYWTSESVVEITLAEIDGFIANLEAQLSDARETRLIIESEAKKVLLKPAG